LNIISLESIAGIEFELKWKSSGMYENLETFSSRGLPRPADDKYYSEMRFSDPVYAVRGQRTGENGFF